MLRASADPEGARLRLVYEKPPSSNTRRCCSQTQTRLIVSTHTRTAAGPRANSSYDRTGGWSAERLEEVRRRERKIGPPPPQHATQLPALSRVCWTTSHNSPRLVSVDNITQQSPHLIGMRIRVVGLPQGLAARVHTSTCSSLATLHSAEKRLCTRTYSNTAYDHGAQRLHTYIF